MEGKNVSRNEANTCEEITFEQSKIISSIALLTEEEFKVFLNRAMQELNLKFDLAP